MHKQQQQQAHPASNESQWCQEKQQQKQAVRWKYAARKHSLQKQLRKTILAVAAAPVSAVEDDCRTAF